MNRTTRETEHQRMVRRLKKPGVQMLTEITGQQLDLLHMAIGVCGEAGELLDAVKKNAIYQSPLDVVNIIEELGDLEFYMEGARQCLGISREVTIRGNIRKLAKRYGEKYSNKAAQNRADKR